MIRNFVLSSAFAAQSGRYFNVFAGSNANGDSNPTTDRPGDLGQNTLQGPGFADWDLRLGRDVPLHERYTLSLTMDAFNLPNETNITDLNTLYRGTNLCLPSNPLLGFGTPRDAANPRQFQYVANCFSK